MSRADAERGQDILDAAAQLAEIVSAGEERFLAEPVLQRATERLLEIIGEAANAMSDEGRASVDGVPWDQIRRLRIRLAHHYHRVDPAQVWEIAANECPRLVRELRRAGF